MRYLVYIFKIVIDLDRGKYTLEFQQYPDINI